MVPEGVAKGGQGERGGASPVHHVSTLHSKGMMKSVDTWKKDTMNYYFKDVMRVDGTVGVSGGC